ncbi:MAG: hypothetical protein JNJ46_25735 [Myxococcales bacterium]|nr:hypothetical protein [Myxococcales bacterium]
MTMWTTLRRATTTLFLNGFGLLFLSVLSACGDPGSFAGTWGGSLSSPEFIYRAAIATMKIGNSNSSADMSVQVQSDKQECNIEADREASALQANLRPGGTCAIAGIPEFKWISGTLSVATGALEMKAVIAIRETEMGNLEFRGSRYK